MPENPRRIDVHHHTLPPALKERSRERIIASVGISDNSVLFDWTPERALAVMDEHGIATAIGSVSTPGIWYGDDAPARDLARLCNEFMAQMTRDHKGRFGFFAAIPLPDRDGSLAEIEYALDTLGADGVGIFTSYRDRWLGDPAFDPVFAELNRRKSVVFVHPTVPACCMGLIPGIHPALEEYTFDTTRAITSFLANGTFSRYPDIRFIFCHGGGTITPIAHRIAGIARNPKLKAGLPNGVLHELRRLFYDTASAINPPNMAALRALVPLSQILFGTDNPYVSASEAATGMNNFGFTADEQAAINRLNALSLFPKYR
jgi:predicted TIM-barrel fold metal-dependent hydrolase